MWGQIAFLIGIAAYVPYNITIAKKETMPKISTWLAWTVLDWATLVPMISRGEWNGVVIAFAAGATITLVNAWMHHATMTIWSKTDRSCLAGAGVGLALWVSTNMESAAIVFLCISQCIGAVPTLEHVLRKPSEESLMTWGMFCLSAICGMLAITEWTIVKAMPPVAFAGIDGAIFILLVLRRV